MVLTPVNDNTRDQWIAFLEEHFNALLNMPVDSTQNGLFLTKEGDVHTAREIVGTMLATLTNQEITIEPA